MAIARLSWRLQVCPSRRVAARAAPAVVPLSMWVTFKALTRRFRPVTAYNIGFAVYWGGWCFAFPIWVLGPRKAMRVVLTGRRPSVVEAMLLALPLAGAIGTQLVGHLRRIDSRIAAVMVGTGVVNAIGEELLWRGMYVEEFPEDLINGALWPLFGFSVWHLAPQTILPARIGRWRFVLGAALVGTASTVAARRGGGLRATLLPHIATDACGLAAAEFRLGRGRTSGP